MSAAVLGFVIGGVVVLAVRYLLHLRSNRQGVPVIRFECASRVQCKIWQTRDGRYVYGTADPRCGGGNCTACCKEVCGGRCGKVALGVIGGGKVLPFDPGRGA